jgi:APA family basic amino acid/polyamine antiporter
MWLFYGLTVSTVFVFRRRDDPAKRPFSMIGYPILPAIFILAAIGIAVFSIYNDPRNSLIGLAIILCGIPIHYILKRRTAH